MESGRRKFISALRLRADVPGANLGCSAGWPVEIRRRDPDRSCYGEQVFRLAEHIVAPCCRNQNWPVLVDPFATPAECLPIRQRKVGAVTARDPTMGAPKGAGSGPTASEEALRNQANGGHHAH